LPEADFPHWQPVIAMYPNAEPLVGNVFRDFIFASADSPCFRIINLTPGRYRVSFQTGDRDFGDHTTRFTVPGLDGNEALPILSRGPASSPR
jgi:hypothetical protein